MTISGFRAQPRNGLTDHSHWQVLVAEVAGTSAACRAAGKSIAPAIDLLRTARYGALRVPRHEGGSGASLREFFASLIDLAQADSDIAHILRAHFWFVEERLRSGNLKERARWLDRVLNGDLFGNAMSELGGSAAVGSWAFRTTLTPAGSAFRLDGAKYYCTGTLYADWVNVFAVRPDGTLASAIIPTRRAGVTLFDDWDGIGQRLTGSGSATFEGVHVEPDEILASAVERDDAERSAQSADPYLIGQFCQLFLTAVIAGALRSVVDDAVRTVRGRARTYQHAAAEQPADDPILQVTVGEIASVAMAAESLVLTAADAQDAALAGIVDGVPDLALAQRGSLLAAQAKVVVDALAQRAATQLFDVGGSAAVKASNGLDRHWRNIRTLVSHNPTAYKARAIGDHLINGTALPVSGFF